MTGTRGKQARKKQVLSDHKRVGKRLIPPLLQAGPFSDVSWVDCALPELLWLGLLNDRYGLEKGADVGLSLAKAAAASGVHSVRRWYALTSAYSFLTKRQKDTVIDALGPTGNLDSLRSALAYLVALYPECPLAFVFEGQVPDMTDRPEALAELKTFLKDFFDKYDAPATLAQANAVYIAFATDILKVVEGVSLGHFPAVADFPNTEESKWVAASVRASIGGFVSLFLQDNCWDKYTPWSRYFWNRGLDLEPCTQKEVARLYE